MLPLMRISDHCPGGDSLIALGTGAAMVTEYYNTCFVLRSDDGRTHEIHAGDVLATTTPVRTAHNTKEKRANN